MAATPHPQFQNTKTGLLHQSGIYILAFAAFCFGLIPMSCSRGSKTPNNHEPVTENPVNDNYSSYTSLSNRGKWGHANVHDPSILKADSLYYLYSTDAYYIPYGSVFNDDTIQTGNIQIRQSKDLIHWEFKGWALNEVPKEAVQHVRQYTEGKGADGIWAPYIKKEGSEFRLYYSVSCFGTNSSYIGLAVANHPLGPWEDKGCVVKSTPQSAMNAIDPTVVTDPDNGKEWMIYGSYFGGIHCLELNRQTGLALKEGDQGHLVATRSNPKEQIIEAPEIIFHPNLKKYFLFVSYDPLFTHYNVRVGQSDQPQGPYYDYFGKDLADTTNNYPVLTHSYMFDNHPGWSGNGHCAILNDNGQFFMLHQGRLAPDNLMMLLHVREMKWLPSGWPVVSPQRYVGELKSDIQPDDLIGEWEVIEIKELADQVKLWQGQIPPGGWTYNQIEFNKSEKIVFNADRTTNSGENSHWSLRNELLTYNENECMVFRGWDWENNQPAILFAGIMKNGCTIWGKKVNLTEKIQ